MLTTRSAALREKAGKAVIAARAILDAHPADAVLAGEDETRYRALMNEYADSKKAYEDEERLADAEAETAAPLNPITPRAIPGAAPDGPADPAVATRATPEYARAFNDFLLGRQTPDLSRAIQMDSDTGGGYLVAPQQFMANLIQNVDNQVLMRGLSTTYQLVTAGSLGFPSLATDLDDFTWTTELGTGSEDTALAFGKREFRTHPLAKRVKVSKKLMRAAAISPDAIVNQRLSYKLGVTQEKAYLTGTGVQQPLGIFVASNDGIPTTQDVTASATTSWTADNLYDVKYELKPQYRQSGSLRWMFHRDAVLKNAKLKDGNGNYLLQPAVSDTLPDRILGIPFLESEYAPSTFTAGLYVGILADFSWYWIVDALDMQVQRLTELYAETNQDGFIARYEGDGMPVLPEAFVRLVLAP